MQAKHQESRRPGARTTRLAIVGVVAMAAATVAMAGNMIEASVYEQGEFYSSVPEASGDQAQVIVFRGAASDDAPRDAQVYVDRQLHTALLPDSFTRLCVAPGEHSVEAYFNDAPLYLGKQQPRTRVELSAGATYFVELDEAGGDLVPLTRESAEEMLHAAREQLHLKSRAAAVQPCRETGVVATGLATPDVSPDAVAEDQASEP